MADGSTVKGAADCGGDVDAVVEGEGDEAVVVGEGVDATGIMGGRDRTAGGGLG